MEKDFRAVYELIDDFFKDDWWYDPTDRELVILEEWSIEYPWGWLIEFTSKEFMETKDPEKAPLGLKPLIVDLKKQYVVYTKEWPIKSIEKIVEEYEIANGYPPR